jgi:hypothetical protein
LEHFEKLALDSAQRKPELWLWYVDDTFVVWPHGPELLQNFLIWFCSLRPSIQFTMEVDSVIPFLDILVIRKEMTLATKVYRKPTHTGRYLNFRSNHLPHVKRGLIQSLHSRVSPQYAKNKICLRKLAAWDMIFSPTVILTVSLTQLLTPKIAVIWIKRKHLWALWVSHMWRLFRRNSVYRETI